MTVPPEEPMTLHEAVDAAFGAMQCRDAACANCGECRDSFHKALDRLLPAAPPSGEAPKLTAEQVRQADEIATGMIRHPIKPDYYRRMADALNGVLGSAPQKEVK